MLASLSSKITKGSFLKEIQGFTFSMICCCYSFWEYCELGIFPWFLSFSTNSDFADLMTMMPMLGTKAKSGSAGLPVPFARPARSALASTTCIISFTIIIITISIGIIIIIVDARWKDRRLESQIPTTTATRSWQYMALAAANTK